MNGGLEAGLAREMGQARVLVRLSLSLSPILGLASPETCLCMTYARPTMAQGWTATGHRGSSLPHLTLPRLAEGGGATPNPRALIGRFPIQPGHDTAYLKGLTRCGKKSPRPYEALNGPYRGLGGSTSTGLTGPFKGLSRLRPLF